MYNRTLPNPLSKRPADELKMRCAARFESAVWGNGLDIKAVIPTEQFLWLLRPRDVLQIDCAVSSCHLAASRRPRNFALVRRPLWVGAGRSHRLAHDRLHQAVWDERQDTRRGERGAIDRSGVEGVTRLREGWVGEG